MVEIIRQTTVVGNRLLGDSWTGPYRCIEPGEEVDPEDVHELHRHANEPETLVPVRIYGHRQNKISSQEGI